MSIFSNSSSEFSQRRADAIRGIKSTFFYASWFLLRMRSEKPIRSPNRVRYHWQRAPFSWKRKGALRKARKNFPKDHQRKLSLWQAAYRWYVISMPLT
jgi:hypothetical protein